MEENAEPDDPPDKSLNFTLIKNVVCFCTAFSLYLSGLNSIYPLQSSLNRNENAGYYGLVSRYIGSICINLFLPSLSIKFISLKWTFWFGIVLAIPYMVAQMFAGLYVMIACGAISGVGRGLYYATLHEYVNIMAKIYINKNKSPDKEKTLGRFFTLFGIFDIFSGIMGSTASIVALRYDRNPNYNETGIDYKELCGPNYCPGVKIESPRLERPEEKNMQILSGIGLVLYLSAYVFTIFFVKSERRYKGLYEEKVLSICQTTLSSVKLLRYTNQWIFVFMGVIVGITYGYLNQSYSESYIACVWGPEYVQLISIFGTIISGIMGSLGGYLLKYFKRIFIISAGCFIDVIIIVFLMLYYPTPNTVYVFFILEFFSGTSKGFAMQTNALRSVFFPNHVPETSCNFLFAASVGFIIIYSLSPTFCNDVKLPLVFGVVVLNFVLYLILEWRKPETIK